MNYAELEIAIQCVPDGSYTVDIRFRAEPGDLDRELAVNVPVRINKAELLAASSEAHAYGVKLAGAFFADQRLREAWITARASADARDVPIRLRLRLDPSDPELHGIRWETVVDDQGGTMARSERLLFSRYLESADMTRFKIPTRHDVTALVVVASPSNLSQFSLAPIDTRAEAARVTQALADIPAATLVTGSSAGPVTLTAVVDALRFGYSILYLVCHGTMVKGIPYLALENESGETEWVAGNELAERIRDLGSDRRPNMVILASCQSVGVGQDSDTPAALGPQLARAGVAAVIGMQGNIPLPMVARLMPRFFEQLAEDGQVDRALAAARTGLRPDDPWWMPVLFLRTRDGQIWRDTPTPLPTLKPPAPPPPARPAKHTWAIGALVTIALLAVAIAAFLSGRDRQALATPTVAPLATAAPTTPPPPTATLEPTAVPTPTPAPPAPLAEDDERLMVLLTHIDAPAAPGRDLTDELEADLRRTLEQVAFSKIVVARYNGAVRSDAEARELAQKSRAPVVLWGGGSGPSPTLHVRVGDTSVFPAIPPEFASNLDLIRRTSEVDLRLDLSAPELPSASMAAASLLNVLITVDGNDEIFRIAALLDRLGQEVTPLAILGSGTAVRVHRYFALYYSKPEEARPIIDAALDDDPSNPLLQLYSAVLYQRLGQYEDGYEDAQAAYDFAPTWAGPNYLLALDRLEKGFAPQAAAYISDMITNRPTDSFPLTMRGAFYYLSGLDDAARSDLEQAIELGPTTPMAYNYAVAVALRQGRIDDARALLAAADERFRDQFKFDKRFWRNMFGEENIIAQSISALAELTAGQNRDAIASANVTLAMESVLAGERLRSDMHLIIGIAECRRGQPQASFEAYDKALNADPSYGLLYILRAEANKNLGNGLAAIADLNAAATSPQGEQLAPMIQSAQLGELTCQNAFEVK